MLLLDELSPDRIIEIGLGDQGRSWALAIDSAREVVVVSATQRATLDGSIVPSSPDGPPTVHLVVDHAGGAAHDAVAAFRSLFPRLGPGSMYLLEGAPEQFTLQLALSMVDHDLVGRIAIGEDWLAVQRGSEGLAEPLDLDRLYHDDFHVLG